MIYVADVVERFRRPRRLPSSRPGAAVGGLMVRGVVERPEPVRAVFLRVGHAAAPEGNPLIREVPVGDVEAVLAELEPMDARVAVAPDAFLASDAVAGDALRVDSELPRRGERRPAARKR